MDLSPNQKFTNVRKRFYINLELEYLYFYVLKLAHKNHLVWCLMLIKEYFIVNDRLNN